jgi:hypothetical protein
MEFLILQSWGEYEPQFNDPVIFTPALKAAIQAGHFVKVPYSDVVYYGRIISTSLSRDDISINKRPKVEAPGNHVGFFKVNKYLKRKELPLPNDDNTSHSTATIYTSSIEEPFQTPWFNWILSSNVKELVFSFHCNDIISEKYCCSGMENTFFCSLPLLPRHIWMCLYR